MIHINSIPVIASHREGVMTRQCAWCATYLDFVQSETCVTHGICASCVERIRRSTLEELAPPPEKILVGDGHLAPSLMMSCYRARSESLTDVPDLTVRVETVPT